jgi:hypothetical protein
MEELWDSQQPEKRTVYALLLALHLDPKQVVWAQAKDYKE